MVAMQCIGLSATSNLLEWAHELDVDTIIRVTSEKKMSSFDPQLTQFKSASGYRNHRTVNHTKFKALRNNLTNGTPEYDAKNPFVIQFGCPNFAGHLPITNYELVGDKFQLREQLPPGYKRANSYQNYKSTTGHPKGLFYESTLSGSAPKTSTVTGTKYVRDNSHDIV